MRAIYYTEPGRENASLCDMPMPVCGDKDVIIKVMSCSICIGVDGDHDKKPIGSSCSGYPLVPGHEFAGYIYDIGKDVTQFKVGDRVAVDNTVPCDKCYYCRRGTPIHCRNMKNLGNKSNGAMAEYVACQEKKAYLLPDHVTFDEACLAEPVACCMHSMDQMSIKYGDEVLVLGAGPMGIILAQLAKHSNASRVVVIGSTQSKLDIVNGLGIDTILMDREDYSVHEKAVLECYPLGADCLFDATGAEEFVYSVPKLMKLGGRILGYGYYRGESPQLRFPFNTFWDRELTYYSSLSQVGDFGRAVDAIATGKVNTKVLKTAGYNLDHYFEALDRNISDHDVIKIIIHPYGE